MSKYVFFYKENETEDRDAVKYIEIGRYGTLECGHYFPSINLTGACFSMGLNLDEIDFNNITTVLTKDDFIQLDKYNKELDNLGYGIAQGDEKYLKGIELYEAIKPIINKLLSEENSMLFEQVQEEEKEYLKDNYNLDDEDIQIIFDNYNLDYRDRGIVGNVFEDIDEAAREEADQLGYIKDGNDRYFNYETFGEDLLQEEQYLELPNGNIVYYMY